MGIKPDTWIRKMANDCGMIDPFVEHQTANGAISYGLSSFGYDIRIADEFRVFTPNPYNSIVDPKAIDERCMVEFKGERCVIPPNSFALSRTIEHFIIPSDVLCLVLGKSTYARCGILINMTPLDPSWQGYITIEISNSTPLPAVIYANEGIGQVLFFEGDDQPEVTYAMRKGKYQDQTGVTLPRIKRD